MKVLTRTLAAISLMIPLTATAQAACDPGEQEWKFSIVTNIAGHPKGEAAQAFADQINRQLNGRYCVVVYGNSDLFDDNDDLFNALKNGDAHFAAPAAAKLLPFAKEMDIFNLPFLFDGPLHVMEFLNSDTGADMLTKIEDDGFHAFGFWANGMRQMSASVPIRGTQDAAGLTFRVSSGSPITKAAYATMGVELKKMSFSKVYDGLKSGEVQGQENTWANIEGKRFYQVQAATTETNHTYIGYAAVTSKSFLDSLDAETRQIVQDTMKLVTHERNRFAFELNQISKQNIVEDGGLVIKLSKAELDEFRKLFSPVFQEFKPSIGTQLVDAAIEINANADPYN